jgi:hypothetical protein
LDPPGITSSNQRFLAHIETLLKRIVAACDPAKDLDAAESKGTLSPSNALYEMKSYMQNPKTENTNKHFGN